MYTWFGRHYVWPHFNVIIVILLKSKRTQFKTDYWIRVCWVRVIQHLISTLANVFLFFPNMTQTIENLLHPKQTNKMYKEIHQRAPTNHNNFIYFIHRIFHFWFSFRFFFRSFPHTQTTTHNISFFRQISYQRSLFLNKTNYML